MIPLKEPIQFKNFTKLFNIEDIKTKTINPVDHSKDNNADFHAKVSNEPYYNKTVEGTGIQLLGQTKEWQEKIVKEYSKNFKEPIKIRMIEDLGEREGKKVAGLTVYLPDGTREIELAEGIDEKNFRRAMLHEIGHQVFHYSEAGAEDYAKRMLEYFNNQK